MPAKAQHFVPQVYLRNFATRRKKEFFVCCFDKVTRKIFKPNVKNVANQTGFYNFKTHEGEEISIEGFFNDAETKLKFALEALYKKPNIFTLLDNRTVFAQFFVLQESRTLAFRHVHDDTIRLANEWLKTDKPFFPEPTEDDTKEFQARFLVDVTDLFTDILLNMKWILVSNQTNMPFWTSDNPIVRYNPHKSKLMSNLGLKSPGIQLHIPVSSTLAIIICDPFEYADIDSELSAFPPNVDFNNSGQVLNSGQYIFSSDDNFDLAQKMIQKDPSLANPKRSRIIIGNPQKS